MMMKNTLRGQSITTTQIALYVLYLIFNFSKQ